MNKDICLYVTILLAIFSIVSMPKILCGQNQDARENLVYELHMEAIGEKNYDKAMTKYNNLISAYSDTEYYKNNRESIQYEIEQLNTDKLNYEKTQKEEMIKKGVICVGMNTIEVEKAWGFPNTTKTQTDATGFYDIWIYTIQGVPSRYVIFKDFEVVSSGFGDYREADLYK